MNNIHEKKMNDKGYKAQYFSLEMSQDTIAANTAFFMPSHLQAIFFM